MVNIWLEGNAWTCGCQCECQSKTKPKNNNENKKTKIPGSSGKSHTEYARWALTTKCFSFYENICKPRIDVFCHSPSLPLESYPQLTTEEPTSRDVLACYSSPRRETAQRRGRSRSEVQINKNSAASTRKKTKNKTV